MLLCLHMDIGSVLALRCAICCNPGTPATMHSSNPAQPCDLACRYLPVATPYSHRLAQLFDQLQLKPGARLAGGSGSWGL